MVFSKSASTHEPSPVRAKQKNGLNLNRCSRYEVGSRRSINWTDRELRDVYGQDKKGISVGPGEGGAARGGTADVQHTCKKAEDSITTI